MAYSSRTLFLILFIIVLLLPSAYAFGAGNIASISAIEGKNWRHGDIEDMLKTVECLKHHKWTSMMIKRVYFGNWLRDYSQAMDTGALKKAQPETIRILVWLLSFLGFGYATAEFEVTSERLGVYRPEEHIDNPKDYNDNEDARQYDPRLRGPVKQIELEIDPETGMKNYIANGKGDWATSAAFVKYSFEKSIHHGRLYTNGSGFFKGKDEDLAEALRLLGQGLHCLEDFGAHSNYVELALREQGFNNTFTHTGTNTQINLHGNRVFPLVTGTFGMVDFYHSVLGEATDHFTQSEVNEMDNALGTAQTAAQSSSPLITLIKLLSKVPGTRELCAEAEQLQRSAEIQSREIAQGGSTQWQGGSRGIGDSNTSESNRDWSDYPGAAEHSRVSQPDHSIPEAVFPQGQQQNNWNQPPQQDYSQGQWNQQQHPQSFNMADQSQLQGQPPQYQQHQSFGQSDPASWENQQQSQQPPQWNQQDQGQQQNQLNQQDQDQQQPQWNQQQQQPEHQISGPGQQQSTPDINPQPTPSKPLQTPSSVPAGLPGMPNFDAAKTIQQIYPILAFRDKVVRTISAIIEKIPGLEALVDRITETLTIFILSLLAPFVRPVIKGISATLQTGSSTVVDSSGKHQFEPWTDSNCTDPTHSLLSKDHFSNVLNAPAGAVASEILKFIAPRVLYAWQHPDVPIQQVNADIEKVFHHPAIRDQKNELHRNMFDAVHKWVQSRPDRGNDLKDLLSSEGVRAGKNQKDPDGHASHTHNPAPSFNAGVGSAFGGQQHSGLGGFGDILNSFTGGSGSGNHGQNQQHQQQGGLSGLLNTVNSFTSGSSHQNHGGSGGGGAMNQYLNMASHLPIPGVQKFAGELNKFSSFIPGGNSRGINEGGMGSLEVGGRRELMEAEERAGHQDEISRGTSPMPPSGYEEWSGNLGGGYEPGQERGGEKQDYGGGGSGYGPEQAGNQGGVGGYYR